MQGTFVRLLWFILLSGLSVIAPRHLHPGRLAWLVGCLSEFPPRRLLGFFFAPSPYQNSPPGAQIWPIKGVHRQPTHLPGSVTIEDLDHHHLCLSR